MLMQITEHVWYMPREEEHYRPALGYVCSGPKSMVIDTGNSPEHISDMYGYIRSQGMPDPSFSMVTHWHWDHVFGMSSSPAKSLANSLTNERLINMQHWDWSDSALNSRVAAGLEIPSFAESIRKEVPMRHSFKVTSTDISFDSRINVRLDDLMIELHHVGGPHSEDSTVAFVPQDKVLFLGDCYREDIYTGGGSIRLGELKLLLKRLETFDAEWFVPSHEDPIRKDDFMKKMNEVTAIGEVVGDADELTEGKDRLSAARKRDLTEDEIYYVKRFVTGNRYSFIHTKFTPPAEEPVAE